MTAVVPANTMQASINYAKALAESGLLPSAFRKQPANVLWAIEYARTLGLSTMAAITGIHVIDGKPSSSAALISALVRKAGHRLRVSCTGYTATATIVRSDDPDHPFTSVWDLDRAKIAGLIDSVGPDGHPIARDSKGKPNAWQKYPQNLLKARAITEAARDACEEVLFGMHYTPEELGAPVDETGNVIEGYVVDDTQAPQRVVTPEMQKAADDIRHLAKFAQSQGDIRQLWDEAKAHTDGNVLYVPVAVPGLDKPMALGDHLKAVGEGLPAYVAPPDVDTEHARTVQAEARAAWPTDDDIAQDTPGGDASGDTEPAGEPLAGYTDELPDDTNGAES